MDKLFLDFFCNLTTKNAYRETEKQSIWRKYDDDEFKSRFRFRPILNQPRVIVAAQLG